MLTLTELPSAEAFKELALRLRELLKNERSNVNVGCYEAHGALAKIKAVNRLIVIGDLHGDYESLMKIFSKAGVKDEVPQNTVVVFLGDYIDRGHESPHVVYEVFKLKIRNPGSVILLRGNHEGPLELPVYPHDFPMHLNYIYKDQWREVYNAITSCFNYFYVAALLEEAIFMVHGGVPTRTKNVEDIIKADRDISLMEELLWNDPMEDLGMAPSPRGAGFLFGPDVTKSFIEQLKVRVVIRSHEPCMHGYEVHHNGMLITIFSRKGFPYFNIKGAYLDIVKPQNIRNAHQLAENFVITF